MIIVATGVRDGMMTVSNYYMEAVRSGGGVPIAAVVSCPKEADELAQYADALLLTGGYDVNPALYGEIAHEKVELAEDGRDASDRYLFDAFRARGKRILGICRGAQCINVFMGGSLIQHVPDAPGVVHNHANPGDARHDDILLPGSTIAHLFGENMRLSVNTSHHQAAGEIGNGLTITARSDDGLVECLEGENLLCVQWHPERMGDEMLQIFTWLAHVE